MIDHSIIKVHIDGAARGNPGPASIGVVAKKGTSVILELAEYIGETTNNVAEYTALIRALEELLIKGHKKLEFYTDSELLSRQIRGEYRVKKDHLQQLFLHVNALISKLEIFSIHHVPREKNKEADALANRGIDEQSPK